MFFLILINIFEFDELYLATPIIILSDDTYIPKIYHLFLSIYYYFVFEKKH